MLAVPRLVGPDQCISNVVIAQPAKSARTPRDAEPSSSSTTVPRVSPRVPSPAPTTPAPTVPRMSPRGPTGYAPDPDASPVAPADVPRGHSPPPITRAPSVPGKSSRSSRKMEPLQEASSPSDATIPPRTATPPPTTRALSVSDKSSRSSRKMEPLQEASSPSDATIPPRTATPPPTTRALSVSDKSSRSSRRLKPLLEEPSDPTAPLSAVPLKSPRSRGSAPTALTPLGPRTSPEPARYTSSVPSSPQLSPRAPRIVEPDSSSPPPAAPVHIATISSTFLAPGQAGLSRSRPRTPEACLVGAPTLPSAEMWAMINREYAILGELRQGREQTSIKKAASRAANMEVRYQILFLL